MSDQEWKPYGTVTCTHCGRVQKQFVRPVEPGELKGRANSAACFCGWPVKQWSETSLRDYSFEMLEENVDAHRVAKKKRPRDANQLAKAIVDLATGEASDIPDDGKDPAAVSLGRRGGLKGGRARAKSLAPEKRKEIAIKAASARWKKSGR